MGLIPASQARKLFTQETVAFFSDRRKPKAFFRSFFTEVEKTSRYVSIEVERDDEKVAVDVLRSTGGNRNSWSRKTQKIYDPAMFDEYFDATELDCYEDMYAGIDGSVVSSVAFGKFLQEATSKMEGLMDSIDRAYELQAAQALVDGIVVLKNGDNIDFKRKAASLVAYNAAWNWALTTVDPNDKLKEGADFLTQTGKISGNVINVVMGGSVYNAYVNNAKVQARNLSVQYGMDALVPAQKDSIGRIYHGQIAVDNYIFRIWTCDSTYKHPDTGVITPYMPAKKVLMLPEQTVNVLTYAAVPQLLSKEGVTVKKGKFITYEYPDERNATHEMGVKSCGIAIPVAIDQAYTVQVLA